MNLNNVMASSTIKQLRIQAYHMWGIAPNRVVYNMPYKKFKQEFIFKINYDAEFKSWPKSYDLIIPDVCDLKRVIMPIIIVNNKLNIYRKAWYDMSKSVSDQIINIVENNKFYKQSKWYYSLWPFISSHKEQISVEDYIFSVKEGENNNKLIVKVVQQ